MMLRGHTEPDVLIERIQIVVVAPLGRAHHLVSGNENERCCDEPCHLVCEADCHKAKSCDEDRAHDNAGGHLEHACQHSAGGETHALDRRSADVQDAECPVEETGTH